MAIDTYARASSRKQTDQSHPIPGREAQMVENNAGGYVFPVDDWTRLRRFLTLGSEGGSYYVGQSDLTRDNCQALERCIAADGHRTVAEILYVSAHGLAPKNDPAIFALALCLKTGDLDTRRMAAIVVPDVCRIGTHLFQLATCVDALGGWGRLTRKAFADWYRGKAPKNLALQVVKYRQRNGWTHRDILRLAHPHPLTLGAVRPIVAWAAGNGHTMADPFIHGFEQAQAATDPEETARLVRKYTLPRECVKTEHLGSKEVWAALLERMPLMAMVRNLGKMTSIGLIKPFSPANGAVVQRLRDREVIRKSRIHPIQLLLALKTYAQGHGIRGSLSWTPSALVIDSLDQAYGWAFENVEPSGKRHLLALDVSGSMDCPAGGTVLTCAEAGAAMLMATVRAEPASHAVAFSDGRTGGGWMGGFMSYGLGRRVQGPVVPFPVSARERLDDVLQRTRALTFGRTDCSAPMRYALKEGLEVDVFVIYTDNETWYGEQHPVQALQEYRRKTGIPAKLVVVAMTASGFSIADPADAGMLDVAGFDASVPAVLADFARG